MTLFGVGVQLGAVLPYNRLQESEADRLGLIFMAMAGYDPQYRYRVLAAHVPERGERSRRSS